MDICSICAEERKTWVECPKCAFKCCRGCVKTYLLGLPEITPKCMSCSIRWTYDFIADNTDEKFHNHEYRDHRSKIIFEREKSLLPDTQDYVVQYREQQKLQSKADKLSERIKKLETKTRELKLRRYNLLEQLTVEENCKVQVKSKKFLGHCNVPDCKGFLEDGEKGIVCGLCKQEVCKDCRQKKNDEHTCKQEDVETAKFITSTTKPCPNCHIPIFKTEGCDQMYCVQCHTAFSWKTGALEKGVIHNPHYYEYMRRMNGGVMPRQAGDVVCGGPVELPVVFQHLNKLNVVSSVFESAHQLATHIRVVELPRYRPHNGGTNLDLRIKYLAEEIDENHWYNTLKKREKKNEKNTGINLILTTFVDTIETLMRNLVHGVTTKRDAILVEKELIRINEYTNEQLRNHGQKLGNKVPVITNWKFYRYCNK